MWPLLYGHNHPTKYPYPAEGNFAVAYPANGYLWDRARSAGISYRSYGEFAIAAIADSGAAGAVPEVTVGRIRHREIAFGGIGIFGRMVVPVQERPHFFDEIGRRRAPGSFVRIRHD